MNIKYAGEAVISYLIEKCKSTFASITHAHTAQEVGADVQGSASAALVLAEQYADSKLEEAKSYTDNAVEVIATGKADKEHNHDDKYYTKEQIDSYELITVDDIDTICGANIVAASEVMF